MEKIVKMIKERPILAGALLLVGIPLLSYVLAETPVFPVCGNNDWAGFWGGYLGAIIGGGITLFVMWETNKEAKNNLKDTLENENKNREREEKIQYFNNLMVIWSDLALSTYDFLMYIRRYEAEKNNKDIDLNDIVENIYSENNKMLVLNTQLEILLETRKEVYDVSDILKNVENFEANTKEVFDAFVSAKKVKFANEDKNEYLYSKQDELECHTQTITKKIKETAVNNLY